MSLPEPLLGIGERIVEHFEGGGDPPFQLYVYEPTAEWEVRRELDELRLWLGAADRRINVAAISLARLFWAALEDAGWMESLIAAEQDAAGNPDALADVFESVGEVLRDDPSLLNGAPHGHRNILPETTIVASQSMPANPGEAQAVAMSSTTRSTHNGSPPPVK